MSPNSNNPFAAALEPDSYIHHRAVPPPPRSLAASSTRSRSSTPKDLPPPPSYEEVAKNNNKKVYPREKGEFNLSSRLSPPAVTRDRRSHSDSHPPREYREHREHRERRREDREHHRSSKDKSSKSYTSSSKRKEKKPAVKPKNLDTIDKLDVTSFFGGAGFHHDGPFDACTPHRNKGVKAAPVEAFPVDGPNSSIKGLGPVDKNQQMNLAFGTFENDEDLYTPSTVVPTINKEPLVAKGLYAQKADPSVIAFDSNIKAEQIHGSTTDGLGSSTFVDGAPAPKAYQNDEFSSGIGRKKSLVQRLRKNSGMEQRRASDDFDNYSANEITTSNTNSLLQRVKSLKVSRTKY